MAYTLEEVQTTLKTLRAAYNRVAETGGVTQYTLNSGQGSTSVKNASLSEIRAEIERFENLETELLAIKDGSNFTYMRGGGF